MKIPTHAETEAMTIGHLLHVVSREDLPFLGIDAAKPDDNKAIVIMAQRKTAVLLRKYLLRIAHRFANGIVELDIPEEP